MDKPATVFLPNSSLMSVLNTGLHFDKCIQTAGTEVNSHDVVHGQSASCFLGCKLNLKYMKLHDQKLVYSSGSRTDYEYEQCAL